MFEYLLMAAGLAGLLIGAEFLVRGASQLATACGVSSLMVGLTVVAFGTSAPELAVSVSSSLSGRPDIATGNVVGSNIYNVLLILGLSAVIVPLVVAQKIIRFDVPLMIVASLIVWAFSADGVIGRIEGGLLFAGLLAFICWCVVLSRRESVATKVESVATCRQNEVGSPDVVLSGSGSVVIQMAMILAGLVFLVLGAGWLVEGATEIARRFGVGELVIGLTIVAGGTSMPELATSVVAALRGERDIAVGNVVGSNLFNLLGVLGLSAAVSPHGIPIAQQALTFDIPVMVIVACACVPLFVTGSMLSRGEGALFLCYGVAYTATVILLAKESGLFSQFRILVLGFAVPMAIVTIAVLWRVYSLRNVGESQRTTGS